MVDAWAIFCGNTILTMTSCPKRARRILLKGVMTTSGGSRIVIGLSVSLYAVLRTCFRVSQEVPAVFQAHAPRPVVGVAALAATILAVATTSPATAAVTGHLYVAAGQFEVQRFPLVDGVPAQHADLRIPNTLSPFAVEPDGTLVAQIASGPPRLGFFSLGHTRPDRILNIRPSKPGCAVNPNSIAIDSQGFLYVARSIPDPCLLDDIAVYTPKASGNDNPIATVKTAAGLIAVDPKNGEVFDSVGVLGSPTTIYVFGNLSHHLRAARRFVPAAQFPQQMAINADSTSHTIWIYTTPTGDNPNSVVEYRTTSRGFTFPIGRHFPDNNADVAKSGAVVYWKGFYYSTFGTASIQGIYTYHTHRAPDATLRLSFCCIDHIAVGQ
jgi:hypothetical protein